MMPGRTAVVALLFAGLLAGCATTAPPPVPQPAQVEPWSFRGAAGQRIVTEHYEIFTTLKDRVLLEALPGFVEGAFAYYRELLPPAREPGVRMPVYLFASRTQWMAFTREFAGPRAPVFLRVRNGGYSERGVSVIQYVSNDVTFPLFAHEGFHQYVFHYVGTNIPAWLNEGLAASCEGQRWASRGLWAFDPWHNWPRRNALAQALVANRLHPLQRLLETNAGEVIEGTSESVQTYYAQLWGLVLFLREGADGRYAGKFRELLAAVADGKAEARARAAHVWSDRAAYSYGEALFRSYIAEDVAAVEREYVEFLRARVVGPPSRR